MPAEVRGDSDGADVGMPILDLIVVFVALDFADQVALNVTDGVFTDDAVLAPLVEVLAIETCVESLSQQVHVHIVILQQVEHIHLPNRRHLILSLKI